MNLVRVMDLRTAVGAGIQAIAIASALTTSAIASTAANTGPSATAVAAAPAAATPATVAGPQQAGVLKSVQGDVTVLHLDGRSGPLKSGDAVSPTDRIRTGPASGASLRLRDGTVMVLGPQSQLDLKQYSFDTTTHDGKLLVALLHGSMRMVTGLIAKKQPEAVRVDTQTATIGIRGTDFIVTADMTP